MFCKRRPAAFSERDFSIARFLKTTYFEKHLWTAASENQYLSDNNKGDNFFSPPEFYLIFFLWIEKNSVKVKNSTKLQNKSKLKGYWYL